MYIIPTAPHQRHCKTNKQKSHSTAPLEIILTAGDDDHIHHNYDDNDAVTFKPLYVLRANAIQASQPAALSCDSVRLSLYCHVGHGHVTSRRCVAHAVSLRLEQCYAVLRGVNYGNILRKQPRTHPVHPSHCSILSMLHATEVQSMQCNDCIACSELQ